MSDVLETSMRIALFAPSLDGGGAERVMIILANGFVARGHKVDIILSRAKGPFLSEVNKDVRIIDLHATRALTSIMPLRRYLVSERPDALLSTLSHTNVVAIISHMLARVSCRLVVTEQSSPSRNLFGTRSKNILRLLVKAFYRFADMCICSSQGTEREMRDDIGLPQTKLQTIYNPLDLERIHDLMDERVEHPWFTQADRPVIVATGRLTEAKDYPTLLKAFAHLVTRQPARLLILGQGPLEEQLRQQSAALGINNDVDFLGFQANPFTFMKHCDLYVMSSAWEGLPGALIEAVACGARVVSTDCRTGPREILEDGKWGTLVPVGDHIAMAEAMFLSLSGKQQAPQPILTRFETSKVVEQYIEHLM